MIVIWDCSSGEISPRRPPLTVWADLWSDMDGQEFKVRGRQMVDYIIQYLEVEILIIYIAKTKREAL